MARGSPGLSSLLCIRLDCLLELDFRAQSLQVPVHEGHGQLPAAAAIRDRAVTHIGVEPSLELGLVPALGVVPSTCTDRVRTGRTAGPRRTAPDVTSNWLPWHAHVTVVASRLPLAREHPVWVQVSSNA